MRLTHVAIAGIVVGATLLLDLASAAILYSLGRLAVPLSTAD